MNETPPYPMSALVGLDDLVLALELAAIDPAIGGVLLRGDKGSAKTTAARALASLLPDGAPFVEIPLGATEDRVVGSVDVAAVLTEGAHRFQAGLLQAADGGVLYVDEVNLLADHLVDVLLDAAATGVNRIERDGESRVHASRFVLIGSMNPEEGELRPQLLDRFGLSVRVATTADPDARAEAVRRRLAFDADPVRFVAAWSGAETELAARLRAARPVPLTDGLERAVAELCLSAGAEGLRADLVICRAAAALGGWREKAFAGEDEVAAVAPLALGHRRRTPFGPTPLEPGELDEMLADAFGSSPSSAHAGGDEGRGDGRLPAPGTAEPPASGGMGDGGAPEQPLAQPPAQSRGPSEASAAPDPIDHHDAPVIHGLVDPARRGASNRVGRRRSPDVTPSGRGRVLGAEPVSATMRGPIAAAATVLASAVRSAGARPLAIEGEDLRTARREQRSEHVVVLAVDTSGSMGVSARVAAARGAVLALVADAYQRRDRVAVVAYRDEGAQVLLRPTSSTEVALARLGEVATGGRTPLAAGLDAARALALEERRRGAHPVIVVVTDGRATFAPDGEDPVTAALRAAKACRTAGFDGLVVDCEASPRPLGIARALAEEMGARYVAIGGSLDDGPRGGELLADAIASSID